MGFPPALRKNDARPDLQVCSVLETMGLNKQEYRQQVCMFICPEQERHRIGAGREFTMEVVIHLVPAWFKTGTFSL